MTYTNDHGYPVRGWPKYRAEHDGKTRRRCRRERVRSNREYRSPLERYRRHPSYHGHPKPSFDVLLRMIYFTDEIRNLALRENPFSAMIRDGWPFAIDGDGLLPDCLVDDK